MTKHKQKNMTYLINMGLHEQAAIQFGKIDMKVKSTSYGYYGMITWKKIPTANGKDIAGFWLLEYAGYYWWVPVTYER